MKSVPPGTYRCAGAITTPVYAYNPGGKNQPKMIRKPGERCTLGATSRDGLWCKHHARRPRNIKVKP